MNLLAFLSMLGACEGADYDTLFGGQKFVGYDDHPRKTITAGGYTSTAAGRYQILAGTWDDFLKAVGPRHFDPAGQDECAVWLIQRRGALPAIQAGELGTAIQKCGAEWASLPGSPYGQRTRSMDFCVTHYLSAGGQLADTQPAAPITDNSTEAPMAQDSPNPFSGLLDLIGPVASIFNPLAGALISAFTPLAKEKLTKEINRHTDNPAIGAQVADGVIAAAQRITGLLDPVDAVSAARKDPAIMAQIESAALAHWDQISATLDKLEGYDKAKFAAEEDSRDRASARAKDDPNDQDTFLTRTVVAFFGVALFSMAAGIVTLAILGKPYGELLTLFAGLLGILSGKYGTRYDHRYGGSRQSSAKDATINELARKP